MVGTYRGFYVFLQLVQKTFINIQDECTNG